MDYIIPEAHKELLQAILKELVLARTKLEGNEELIYFITEVIEPDPEPTELRLGEK